MAGKTKTITQIRKVIQGVRNGWPIREIARNIEAPLWIPDYSIAVIYFSGRV